MKQYKILGQMKMEKLEEELNRLADDGWHVSVVYPYQFKEQLKLFILRRTITAGRSVARSTCSTTSSWVNERYSSTSSATHPLGTRIRSGRRMSAKKKMNAMRKRVSIVQ